MPTGGRLTIETSNVTLDRGLRAQPGGRGRRRRVRHAVGHRHRQRHAARRPDSASSSRSSPPRRWARAPALASAWSTASSGSRTAISRSTARSADGTTVRMYFPRSDRRRPRRRRRRGARPLPRGSERILVVEDEEAVRAIVGEQLGGLGYDVQLARRCRPGAWLLLRSHRFDLVLTDVVMPGRLNGRAWPTRSSALARHAHRLHVRLFGKRAVERRPPRQRRDAARQAASEGRSCQDHSQRARRQRRPSACGSAVHGQA